MENKLLHDWTLVSIEIDWSAGRVQLGFRPPQGGLAYLIARDFLKIEVPRRQEWGPSSSVMSHVGPRECGDGLRSMSILIQTGDSVEITAREIQLPAAP